MNERKRKLPEITELREDEMLDKRETYAAPPGRSGVRKGGVIGSIAAAFMAVLLTFAYFMGWIDTASVAAHAIALQIASISFMVPLGLSQATVIRVGLAYGAGDKAWVARAGWTSLAMAMAFMGVAALIMWLGDPGFIG